MSDLVGEDGFFPDQEALMARADELGRAIFLHISASVRIRLRSNPTRSLHDGVQPRAQHDDRHRRRDGHR